MVDRGAPIWTRIARSSLRSWRTGSTRSQVAVLAALLVGVAANFAVSLSRYDRMPLSTYFIWLLLGMLMLRFRLQAVLGGAVALAVLTALVVDGAWSLVREVGLATLLVCIALILYAASRQRSGLPGLLSDALLSELHVRLQSQGRLPELPAGWEAQSAMVASHGVAYAGDFFVADLRDEEGCLELVLVDVCGKGLAAGPAALQFAGALGGLIGAVTPAELFHAANNFLLRLHEDEQFATAVHVALNLETGEYCITSAGHPPALRWDVAEGAWTVDNSRGTALGIVREPELHSAAGTLGVGEGLMFYTDGVVESRSSGLEVGIAWLRETARAAIAEGWPGAAQRIVSRVERGDDDRAVLILSRSGGQAAEVTPVDASTADG